MTNGKFVVDYHENKEEKERMRLSVGGVWNNYLEEVASLTADILTVKLMLNNVISTPSVTQMMVDIKNCYLNTPPKRYKYLKVTLSDLPEDVIE